MKWLNDLRQHNQHNPRTQGRTPELSSWLTRQRPRVLVLGDAILDGWLSGQCHRLCREAPAPVVDVEAEWLTPGGAANTAANLAALGAEVSLLAVIGVDSDGQRLCEELRRAGVDTTSVLAEPERRTVAKRRLVAGDQLLARFDEGDGRPLAPATARRLGGLIAERAADCDAVLVDDYGSGVLDDVVRRALRRLRASLPLLVVDAHDLRPWAGLRPDVVTPNAEEIAKLLGDPLPEDGRVGAVEERRADLLAATGAGAVVVTLDRDGSVLLTEDETPRHRTWARPAATNHTAGAGDTYVAALTVAAAVRLPLTTCVELAQAAADVVVSRPGTSVCTATELAERLGSYRHAAMDHDELARVIAEHRAAGRRIVFTNGCFDVVHRGHVAYLNHAKRLGAVLVVAINSDASVARLKGPDRPVNSAEDRAAVLAALSCVDHVTVFAENTPVGLLELLRPDVYVKGGDYTPEMLPETPVMRRLGGEVRILDYVADHSTTAIIERIRGSARSSAAGGHR